MEDPYQLPDGLLVIGVIIAAVILIATLTRAYLRTRRSGGTEILDRIVSLGGFVLAGWVALTVLWLLVDEPEALLDPIKIIGVTLLFFAVGIGVAFAIAWVFGRLNAARRRA